MSYKSNLKIYHRLYEKIFKKENTVIIAQPAQQINGDNSITDENVEFIDKVHAYLLPKQVLFSVIFPFTFVKKCSLKYKIIHLSSKSCKNRNN